MVEVKGLTKRYGGRVAIDNLNFSIQTGEVVGFLGPNGAGKSTTMKIITGMLAADSGQVIIDGQDNFENPIEVKKKIGFLPEHPPLYEEMTVEDFLLYVAHLKKVPSEEIEKNISDSLQATSIEDVRKRVIGNLSKGYRQRVGISQALVSKPEILILDEPTVGLDPKQVSQIRELILKLKGEYTIILSTHILSEVQATCDRVIIINQGTIVSKDTVESLQNMGAEVTQLKLKVRRNFEELNKYLNSLDFVLSVVRRDSNFDVEMESGESHLETVSKGVFEKDAGLLDFRTNSKVDLEQAFLKITESRGEG